MTKPLFTENVIPQLLAWRALNIPSALVTLVGVDGSSPRRIGSQMAVTARGEFQGYISSGCAEGAIVAEARSALERGTNSTVRYGAGSKYIDIVLPCGSGIDVHFDATVSSDVISALQADITARRPTALSLDLTHRRPAFNTSVEAVSVGATFVRTYQPIPRIVVAGRGVNVDYVARFAHELEWDVVVASPDTGVIERLGGIVSHTQHLTRPDDFNIALIDANTALVLVFHDHEWEPQILAKSAASPAFYFGALGSRRTHAQRMELLAVMGCSPEFIGAIHSPIGLDIAAKNPAEIGLAIIAEILSLAPSH
jgi:xanthine dehydrogenase accessory factor